MTGTEVIHNIKKEDPVLLADLFDAASVAIVKMFENPEIQERFARWQEEYHKSKDTKKV